MPKPRGFSSEMGLGFDRGPYQYRLVPWTWNLLAIGGPYWHILNSIGKVDLRSLSAQAAQGGVPQGRAFCASLGNTGGDLIATAPHMSDVNATAGMQSAWQSAMAYTPQGAKLVDLLWDQLTTGSDPSGASGPKPLMPMTDGFLRLFVPGHSLVKEERFEWGRHPHTNRVRDVLRADFAAMWEADPNAGRRRMPRLAGASLAMAVQSNHEHCRRMLGYLCRQHKINDWREFVPQRLRVHVPGPLTPATTQTDDFPGADQDVLAGSLTWTEVLNDIDRVSNMADVQQGGSRAAARADADVSSADHYVQASTTLASGSFVYGGPCARFSSSAETFYFNEGRRSDNTLREFKDVAGTMTELAATAITLISPDTYKTECNGSTIKGFQGVAERHSVTDTAITTGTRGGLIGLSFTGEPSNARLRLYEISDLAATAEKNFLTLLGVGA